MLDSEPKIYVACLAAYNNGRLHGAWIAANQDADCIHEEIKKMLSESPEPHAEEWAIHDYEGFGKCKISENKDIESVSAIAKFISEHGEVGMAVLAYLGCDDLENAEEMMTDHHQGLYASEESFAREWLAEMHTIPEYLEDYIDYKRVAHDWFTGDFLSLKVDHQVAVFAQC